jgi:uncharacterized integral membrane protein
MLDWLGWVATGVFGASYFCKRQVTLRLVQAFAAILWIAYGLMIHAMPVVVANLVVATIAIASTFMRRSRVAEAGNY